MDRDSALVILRKNHLPAVKRLRTVLSPEYLDDHLLFAYACQLLDNLLPRFEELDPRMLTALETRKAWLRGEASYAELEATYAPAYDADREATANSGIIATHAPPVFYYSHGPIRNAIMSTRFATTEEALLKIWELPQKELTAEVVAAFQAGRAALLSAFAEGSDAAKAAEEAALSIIDPFEETYFHRMNCIAFFAEATVVITRNDAARAAWVAAESALYILTGKDDYDQADKSTKRVRREQVKLLIRMMTNP